MNWNDFWQSGKGGATIGAGLGSWLLGPLGLPLGAGAGYAGNMFAKWLNERVQNSSWLNSAQNENVLDRMMSYFSGQDDLNAQIAAQLKLNQQAQAFNSAEAQKDRDWQQMMSNTAIQRQVADLKAAGLNPWLALQGGISGSSTPSGAVASSSAGQAASRTENWSKLLNAANNFFSTGKNFANGIASSAMKLAGLAIMALGA